MAAQQSNKADTTAAAQASGTPATPSLTPDQAFTILIEKLSSYIPNVNEAQIKKAYQFAANRHGPQLRQSGEPYIIHPLAVATILTELKVDVDSIIAALLHDVVEDTDTPLSEIESEFGKHIAELVDGLTKIGKIEFRSNQEKLAENFRKMILAMAKDLRVILVKLADRTHNMRTLAYLAPEKRDRIAQETLDIYAPLAHRLGIYGIKSELEDLCLRQLKREVYQDLRKKIAAKKAERQAYIDEVNSQISQELVRYNLKTAVVYGRPKHFYSIYKKMLDRNLAFEDVHDLFAFRIIVETVKDCYEALGIVHSLWKPMPGRFKDYIAMPKANLYQSLHTTVIRSNGEPAEIQIRTKEMHDICEYGIAAHWTYKEKSAPGSREMDPDLKRFAWMRQMMTLQSEIKDPDEFLEAVKVDLFDEEIYVFTPKGDVIELPTGATALDFAFSVHTGVGVKTIGAKVNGRMVPIKTPLKSGDIIEILTSPNQKPSKDWLNIVSTSKAKNKIRSYLRSEQRDKSKQIGIDLLQQELQTRDLDYDKLAKTGGIQDIVTASRESNLEELLIGLGYGRLNAKEVITKAFPQHRAKTGLTEGLVQSPAIQPSDKIGVKKPIKVGSISVSGIENVLVTFGRCCNPLPGDEVVGFITRGRGVTVHRVSCVRAHDLDPSRRVDVSWSGNAEGTFHIAYLRVVARDKMGVLADITSSIASCGGNIQKANVRINPDGSGLVDLELGLTSLTQLKSIMTKLEGIHSVIKVERRCGRV